jgi:hypothetical protein
MTSKSNVIYTARDQQIHELLALTPLDTHQLLRASQLFEQPFPADRVVRRRMQGHTAAGWVQTFIYATKTAGQLNYYQLAPEGFRMLQGPDAPLPKRSAFREVSPSLERHTRHLADIIVATNIAARRLGVEIQEQVGENRLTLVLGDREQKPDYSFRLATRDGLYTYYDELDEATEPIASNRQRESLEAKIRFHEEYQNATGERYRVRMIFAKASPRMVQFLNLAHKHAKQQRRIFFAVLLENYVKHGSPFTAPIFVDHFHQITPLVKASNSHRQRAFPTFAEILAKPVAVC